MSGYGRLKFFLVLTLVLAMCAAVKYQAGVIDQQRTLIRSFYEDKNCMHDPRGK